LSTEIQSSSQTKKSKGRQLCINSTLLIAYLQYSELLWCLPPPSVKEQIIQKIKGKIKQKDQYFIKTQ
jgi:UDP-galactopyranose mutase